jgi:hypothetical protein
VTFVKRLLHRMQGRVRRRQALDGGDLMSLGLDREHQARADRHSIEQHRAAPANAVLAPNVRAGKAEVVAEVIRQQPAWIRRRRMLDAVDFHRWLDPEVRRRFRGIGGRSQGMGGAARSASLDA